jgi:hypothetical protein|tara:strand:+ start:1683 stop:1835 length:153 start_codon:yes stop_codon:yes gene_type:complete
MNNLLKELDNIAKQYNLYHKEEDKKLWYKLVKEYNYIYKGWTDENTTRQD